MAIIGRKRAKTRNSVRNKPMVPANVHMSTQVGWKNPQEVGRKSRVKLVAIITKRSNHMPMLVVIEITNITHRLVRSFLNQYSCGINTLHEYMDHAAHQ